MDGRRDASPACRGTVLIRSGHACGLQRWKCKGPGCGRQFTRTTPRGKPVEVKRHAIELYGLGLSERGSQARRGLGAEHAALGPGSRASPLSQARAGARRHGGGRDRRGLALRQKKSRKLWIWKAFERGTGRLIEWECGGRDQGTLDRLLKRLERWGVRLFCTDDDAPYDEALPVGRHYIGKDQTQRSESNNSRQRHWLARFRRRTCVVSRSVEMVDATMALFAFYYCNGGSFTPALVG